MDQDLRSIFCEQKTLFYKIRPAMKKALEAKDGADISELWESYGAILEALEIGDFAEGMYGEDLPQNRAQGWEDVVYLHAILGYEISRRLYYLAILDYRPTMAQCIAEQTHLYEKIVGGASYASILWAVYELIPGTFAPWISPMYTAMQKLLESV